MDSPQDQAEAEEDETYVYPLSGEIFNRPKGDILQADRCPPHIITELKAHSREWANQEQQEPTATTVSCLIRTGGNTIAPVNRYLRLICSALGRLLVQGAVGRDFVAIHKWA